MREPIACRFFWTVLSRPRARADRLRKGLNATTRIVLLGLLVDLVYQLLVLKTFDPTEAVIIALFVGCVPYVLVRGLATRGTNRWFDSAPLREAADRE